MPVGAATPRMLSALSVLFPDHHAHAFFRSPVPCRDAAGGTRLVALVFGQSNAANSGPVTAFEPRPGVHAFYRGRCYQARDPLPGATGSGSSVWTRLGDKLVDRRVYDSVLFVPVAVAGSEIRRWTPTGDLHPRLLDAIRDVRRADVRFTHLLWHQGESDAENGTSTDDYIRMFNDMLDSLRSHGVDAPIYVAVATRCRRLKPGSAAIQHAQRSLVEPSRHIHAGPDTDALGPEYRHDGCHFGEAGLDRFAKLWLETLTSGAPPAQPRRS